MLGDLADAALQWARDRRALLATVCTLGAVASFAAAYASC